MFDICIAGKNDISVNALDFLIYDLGINKRNICVAPNSTDNGVDSWQKSLKRYAIDNEILIKNLEDIYDLADVFISLEFNKIVKPQKFKSKKIYNMHFSALPAYKGMYTSVFPILNGEKQSGVTFHCIDEGIDTGDIIAQKAFDISLEDTARDLYFKYLENSFHLFRDIVKDVLDGNIASYHQSKEGSSYYSSKTLDFQNICIDFKKTSFEIYNQIRAFIFKEYQLPEICGQKIYNVLLLDEKISPYSLIKLEDKVVISGIDGFKIEAFYDQLP